MKKIFGLVLFLLPVLGAQSAYADAWAKTGITSKCFLVQVKNSSVTTGAGLTGISCTGASCPTCYYYEEGSGTPTSITMASSTLGTYTSGAFKEIDATNMPGWYEFCPPNAALDGGTTKAVVFECKGVTNMAQMDLRVNLTPTVNVSTFDSDAIDASAIAANAIGASEIATDAIGAAEIAADAIGSSEIATDAIGASEIAASAIGTSEFTTAAADQVWSTATRQLTGTQAFNLTGNVTGNLSGSVGSVTGAVGSVTGNVGGNVTGSVGSVTGTVGSVTGNVGGNVTGSVGSVASGGITAGSIASDAITAAKIANDAIGSTEVSTAAAQKIAAQVHTTR